MRVAPGSRLDDILFLRHALRVKTALQGEWSRLKYQQNPMRNGASTVKEMTAVLPRDASALYFRDEIGNVSTSVVRRLRDKTEVRLQPRFPLLGGWQVMRCCPSHVPCLAQPC